MNKDKYIAALTGALRGKIASREIDDIVRDYKEFFEDGKIQGRTEEEVAEELGNPTEVAKQLLSEERFAETEGINSSAVKESFAAGAEKLGENFKSSFENVKSKMKDHSESAARQRAQRQEEKQDRKNSGVANEKSKVKAKGDKNMFLKGLGCLMAIPILFVAGLIALLIVPVMFAVVVALFAAISAVFALAPLLPGAVIFSGIMWMLFGISLAITIFLAVFYYGSKMIRYISFVFFGNHPQQDNYYDPMSYHGAKTSPGASYSPNYSANTAPDDVIYGSPASEQTEEENNTQNGGGNNA